jgi:hypothetical protein
VVNGAEAMEPKGVCCEALSGSGEGSSVGSECELEDVSQELLSLLDRERTNSSSRGYTSARGREDIAVDDDRCKARSASRGGGLMGRDLLLLEEAEDDALMLLRCELGSSSDALGIAGGGRDIVLGDARCSSLSARRGGGCKGREFLWRVVDEEEEEEVRASRLGFCIKFLGLPSESAKGLSMIAQGIQR